MSCTTKGMPFRGKAWHGASWQGGLYGVGDRVHIFGESMFSLQPDASKAALVALSGHLDRHGFDLIDCQVTTNHLCRMGALEIPRNRFLDILGRAVIRRPGPGVWNNPSLPCM